ncbi:hypothetical protein COS55_03975 [Candidatus Shapirobacteria bacterium CG03_land_8_20_14_0_80_40_19]|uniref:ParB-like N-terminal domain-containing protein n=3 Tax=Candidatus Shapironibacteriota TaxID=1752721 RepID=A0A2M7BAU7_9BACT|nr:MAG: hypothetical protein COV89_02820 [Candidatus Shapirobacteria bacterium CG11_big_fil_rev_8_21_14_0_20_40_12]PIV00224.1 MAG: hypothetical protein COS55_03975 [Candidatus Shapirobacteria bacterium CG03_land_8_20_14_0_80_40_19]PJC76095.1 MAG: hypothetical protein CO010_03765 [Candidatus Shapirobacteria bacterium CG_4_8_14_3_um_filter_39_11]
MADDQIIKIFIDELQSNPLQPRGVISPESIVDLVDSIRQHGILEPLIVAATPAGYQIIAGERRWRAAKVAGLKNVPCIVRETTPRGMLEMAIVENIQRIDLNPVERAKSFQRLIDEFMLSTSDIAKRIGKSQAYVSNSLRLLTLPDAVKDGILSGIITEGHARALAAIVDPRLMLEAFKMVLRENASVRRAEDIARRVNATQVRTKVVNQINVDKETDRMKEEIEKKLRENAEGLTKKAIVKLTRSRSETKILILLKGPPEETEEKLQLIYKGICR